MKNIEKKGKALIAVTVAAVFVVLIGFLNNTVAFERMLGNVVEQYVSEKNSELAGHISYRMKAGQEFVKDFADTLDRRTAGEKETSHGTGRHYSRFQRSCFFSGI